MKKYVKPDVKLVMLAYQDICTASVVDKKGDLVFNDYDFGGTWF